MSSPEIFASEAVGMNHFIESAPIPVPSLEFPFISIFPVLTLPLTGSETVIAGAVLSTVNEYVLVEVRPILS